MPSLELLPAEAVVLRHALMTYRNDLAQRDFGPSMGDGFELAAADTLIERLDIMDERLLTDKRRLMNAVLRPAI